MNQKENNPLVSAIIPTYNRSLYICEAVESVLAQTYKNLEIIIVDDGSTDDTAAKLEPYKDKVRYFYQENQGPSAARNLGIEKSLGKYIAFLDSDDIWLPEKLEVQVEHLESHPEVGMSHVNIFVEKMSKGPSSRILYHSEPCPDGFIFSELFAGLPIPTPSVLVRRECFKVAGLFDPELRLSQDNQLWMRIARHFRFEYIHKPLAVYRLHNDNRSGNRVQGLLWSIRARDKLLRLTPEILTELDADDFHRGLTDRVYSLAYALFDGGLFKDSRKYFLRSIKLQPYRWQSYGYYCATLLPDSLIWEMRKLKRRSAKLTELRKA